MKYANGTLWIKDNQISAFVCAKTYKRMKDLLSDYLVSSHYFEDYWSKTGNEKMKQTAKDKEGVWIETKPYFADYKELTN